MSSVPDQVLAGAPDPASAARLAERVLDALPTAARELSDAAMTILALSCQRAPYLARLLARDPQRLGRVAADPHLFRQKPAPRVALELAGRLATCGPGDSDDFDQRLRAFRADEMVRLGVRELDLGHRAEVGAELSNLADAAFDAAIRYHDAALRERYGVPVYRRGDDEHLAELTVIGMGKLGGQELNFASDVDVIYVYSSDNGEAGSLTLHEYFAKLCERVTQSISRVTGDDNVFKVDLRLRPEGSRGAIANSLSSTERYYETWGRPWERQAWLKARPCAGSVELGDAVMHMMQPFVYPRSTAASIIDDVAQLNRRIKSELDVAGGVESGFDLKNGVGGIREIEFFVQAHQLIHGGQRPTLRARTTLVALDQLLFAGLIVEPEHAALSSAYRYLRHAEHLLQLDSGRQTQRLPTGDELERFARRLGHTDADELGRALAEHTTAVAALFATLGEPADGPSREVTALLSASLEPAREIELLGDLGFAEPARAHRELGRARAKPLSPFHHSARGDAARVAPMLFEELTQSPDPDQALRYASELAGRRGAWSSLWGMFAQNPLLMRLVASLFGTSEFLSKSFVSHPELIDRLLSAGLAQASATSAELATRVRARLDDIPRDDLEERWNRLAETKQAEVLRIGLADIGGALAPEAVSTQLSILAEVVLEAALEIVEGAMRARHGESPAALSVVALGKLGARELGYASDLDLVFVYDGAGESDGARPLPAVTYMTRLAQRLMSGLHTMHPGGRLYEVDTRLRPSGGKGLLVSSLAGWEEYHRGVARLWERQALIKLRPVAGDPELGARVRAAAARFAYRAPGQDDTFTAAEIAAATSAMRDQIERELGSGERYDLKAGRGGIVDVEFAAQFLQLCWGHDHDLLRTEGTVPALRAAAEVGVLGRADAELLIDGYRFLRQVENRMRIVHDRSVHRLPAAGHDLELLARRTGYPDGAELERDIARWMAAIRQVFDRVVGVVAGIGDSG